MIGKSGSVLAELERRTNTKISVDRSGLVTVKGEADRMQDVYKAIDVVKAIGRGFAPHKAFKLLEEGFELRVISLRDYANTKNRKRIIRGRLIGRGGSARTTIENMTNTFISVYGDTVSIIGKIPEIDIAEQAVINLILGRKHSTVFRELNESVMRLRSMEEDFFAHGAYKMAPVDESVEKAIRELEEEEDF